MARNPKEAIAACMALEEIRFRMHCMADRPSIVKFNLADVDLAAKQFDTREYPVLQGIALNERLAYLSFILEHGDHALTRSCKKRHQALQEELQESSSPYRVWAHALSMKLLLQDEKVESMQTDLVNAQRRFEEVKIELENTWQQIKDSQNKQNNPRTHMHKDCWQFFKNIWLHCKAMETEEGDAMARLIRRIASKMNVLNACPYESHDRTHENMPLEKMPPHSTSQDEEMEMSRDSTDEDEEMFPFPNNDGQELEGT